MSEMSWMYLSKNWLLKTSMISSVLFSHISAMLEQPIMRMKSSAYGAVFSGAL